MRYAIANEQRQEAQPGLSGMCPSCGRPMVAKCGEIKIWHWAHLGRLTCDPWWENETEWHRAWKGHFPADWQEVVHQSESGEKHIADVKTDQGWVLEFQHSHLKPEERRAREAFYPNLVWVVDGARRKRDKSQFFRALEGGVQVSGNPCVVHVFSEEVMLLREWAGSRAPVFFDFDEGNKPAEAALWCLLSWGFNGRVYCVQLSRSRLVELHNAGEKQVGQDFSGVLKKLNEIILADISRLKIEGKRQEAQRLSQLARQQQYRHSRRPESFQQYSARRRRARAKKRF